MGFPLGQLVHLAQRIPGVQTGQNHQQPCLLGGCHQRENTLYRRAAHPVQRFLALQKDRHSVQEHLLVRAKHLHQTGRLALLAAPAHESGSQKGCCFEGKVLPCPPQRGNLHSEERMALLPLLPHPLKLQAACPHPLSQEGSPLVLKHDLCPIEAPLGRGDTQPHLGQAPPAQLEAVLG